MNKLCLFVTLCIAALSASAQEPEKTEEAGSVATQAAEKKAPAAINRNSSDQKMVREANINLQTTVTGNQEQPRVMYILPWQSPLSPDLEMEMLSSQEDAVFGHVERDEMQRNLEAAGELDLAED